MKRILIKYARWYNIKYGRSGALIANRYKSVPVDINGYFLQLIRYIHQHPIKANMVQKIEDYKYSSYIEYKNEAEITNTEFVFRMMKKEDFIKFNNEYSTIEFKVTDKIRNTDDEVILHIQKKYNIKNPKEISKHQKSEKNKIITELKKLYSARQLQRITGVSRGGIEKM